MRPESQEKVKQKVLKAQERQTRCYGGVRGRNFAVVQRVIAVDYRHKNKEKLKYGYIDKILGRNSSYQSQNLETPL